MKPAIAAVLAVSLTFALAAPLSAQAQTGLSAPAPGCMRPPPPVFPAPAAAAAMAPDALQQHRYARDAYFAAADANLACLDRDIDARMRTLFATGGAMDSTLRAQGLAHELASRERAETYEKFLRLCLAWEDANGASLGGCR
jgi:hypothetical protein